MPNRRTLSPLTLFTLALVALVFGLACRAADAVTLWNSQRSATAVPVGQASINLYTRTPTEALVLVGGASGELTPTPTETSTPTLTPTLAPTDTPAPTSTPAPTRTRAPVTPTEIPSATPTPAPTRCAFDYCIALAQCLPDNNTRAIGTIFENGAPVNGVSVHVSYSNGGPAIDGGVFVSGHDPAHPELLDPNHPGYYQIGINEGAPYDGNWWVFLVNSKGTPISEGRYFKTTDVRTATSCQIGVTDFGK